MNTKSKPTAELGACEAEVDGAPVFGEAKSARHKGPAPKPQPVACVPQDYVGLKVAFAVKGRTLTRAHRANGGQVSYVVSGWNGERYFTHLHGVQAHLATIQGVV